VASRWLLEVDGSPRAPGSRTGVARLRGICGGNSGGICVGAMRTTCSADGGRRLRPGACLALLILAGLVCAAEGQASCPDAEELKARPAGDTTGHFLSGTISWKQVGTGNKVMFELITTWRRKHHWPCNRAIGFSGPDHWPGIGDELTIVGLSSVASKQARQEISGPVSTRLSTGEGGQSRAPCHLHHRVPAVVHTIPSQPCLTMLVSRVLFVCAGDGENYEMSLKVTSYSVEEDWVMGVSYLEKEYPTPYHSKVPLYEVNGQPLHYASSPMDKDSTQPFKTVPWTVEFKGCCRQFEAKTSQDPKPDSVVNFAIRTTVDLSNHVASPRIVSMPFIFTRAQRQQKIPICALSTGGKEAMVRKNGGTINYPDDDNQTATFTWKVHGYSAQLTSSETSMNGRCTVLTLGQSPTYQFGETDSVTLEVQMGDVLVTGDYFIFAPMDFERITNMQSARSPFGCPVDSNCEAEFSLGKSTPFFTGSPAMIDFESGTTPKSPLEIRYVVATGSHQSTLLSTSQGTLQYSLTDVGEDHAGLPEGARMAPVLTKGVSTAEYVTSLDVFFSADEQNTRPGVDQVISNEQRDYTAHHTAGRGWHLVAGPGAGGATFDDGAGGAHVSVYMEKATQNAADLSNHRHMAAITGVQLANPSQVAGWEDKGYQKLDRDGRSNLLEQSDRGAIYIMFKKGSGPPVTDVSSTAKPGYIKITATTSHSLGNMASRSLWIQYSKETRVSRSFLWEPCTGQDEEVIICANAHAWNATKNGLEPYGGAMQCILLDVVPKTPPKFLHALAETYSATMGKELKIPLRFKRTDLPLSFVEDIPKVRFSDKGTNSQPIDSDRVKGLLTGRTKTGSRITGVDGTTSELSPVTTASDATAYGESEGFLLWTPSPYQGGWKGEVCLDACIDTSSCPAKIGGAVEVCQQTCFAVNVDRCKWALVR